MNKQRRASLQKEMELIGEAIAIIEQAQEEEQECFDNMPEGLQMSERGEQIEEYADSLEEIASYLEDQECELDDIING